MNELSMNKKLQYAMGGLTMNLCDMVFLQWLFVRYAPEAGGHRIAPALFGAIILASRVFEALVGPMIGYWSDGFASPSGRRLPFIRRGLVPLAAVFFLLWFPPLPGEHALNGLYLLVMVPAYLFCYNIVVAPYLGLLPEITADLRERVNITTIQSVFLMGSSFVFAAMGFVLEHAGFAVMAGLVSCLTIVFMLPTCFSIRERYSHEGRTAQRPRFIEGLTISLRNRAFVHVILSTSCYWFALNSVLLLVPFWVSHYLGLGQDYVPRLMVPFLLANLVFFFVFNYLANRYGKFIMFLATLASTGLSFLLLLIVGLMPWGGLLEQSMAVFAVVGMAVAGFYVLPFALLADVVDYDERITGHRREALYVGFQGTFQKAALGLSSFQFSLLAYLGSDHISTAGLKLVALSAGVACLIGFLLFIGYPLRDRGGKLILPHEPPCKQNAG